MLSEPALVAPLASRFQEASPLPPEGDLSRISKDSPQFSSLPVKLNTCPSFFLLCVLRIVSPWQTIFFLLRVLPILSLFFPFILQTKYSPSKKISDHMRTTRWSSSPRAKSARAVTGRRCPHSGKGEDFLTCQPDFFTETAVTPERKGKKLFPRWEINRHAEG